MSGPEPKGGMSDEELRAWTLKRGRIAAAGFIVAIVALLVWFGWSFLK